MLGAKQNIGTDRRPNKEIGMVIPLGTSQNEGRWMNTLLGG
jgi:hypothetical protein